MAWLLCPTAVPALPVTSAKLPYAVTAERPLPLALQPATKEYVPEPSAAWLAVVPGFIVPTIPLEPVTHEVSVFITAAAASDEKVIIKLTVAAPIIPVTFEDLVFPFANSETATHADKVAFQITL